MPQYTTAHAENERTVPGHKFAERRLAAAEEGIDEPAIGFVGQVGNETGNASEGHVHSATPEFPPPLIALK